MKYRYTFLFIVFTLLASAQVQPTYPVKKAEGRPTIGLCLSGGGAKGFAHIGIIKIIDSLGIPIDYVTGTSMGAIMGGLYAIGYTGEQIEESVESTDWLALMSSTPERKYQSFSTKDFAERNLFTVGLEGFNIVLPAGLNSASKVYQKLHNVTIGYHGYQNFLEFPRGFICIGADLNSGEEVVFTEGSLPDAMRASMAIPSVFTPHEVNGLTVVDGGTLNNFPTDQLVKLGCDIIIGIDLSSPPKETDDISLTEVLEKSAMFMNKRNYQKSVERCDILIHPDMKGNSGGDFDKATEIIACGTEAGKKHMSELVELANKLNGTPVHEIEPYQAPDSIAISRIDVLGLKKVSKSYVLGVIDNEDGGKSIEELETSMNALDGSQYFNTVSYNLFEQEDNSYVMEVNVDENHNDLDIGVSLHYDPDFEMSFLFNLSTLNALIKGSRFNLDAVVSPRPRFRLLYEVDRGWKPGFGLRSNFYFTKPEIIENNASEGTFNYDDWTTALYVLFSANNKAVLRLGGEFNFSYFDFRDVPLLRNIFDPNNEDPNATRFTYDHFNLFSEVSVDVLDNTNYPTKGHYFYAIGRYHASQLNNLGSVFETHFLTFYVQYKTALSPNRWLTIIPELTGGLGVPLDVNSSISLNYTYSLGGLGRNYFNYQTTFLGYRYNELFGLNNVAKGGIEVRANPFGKHYVSALFNYALTVDKLDLSTAEREDFVDFFGWGVKYGINTFLGPVEITAHKNIESGPWLFYFNLGYWF